VAAAATADVYKEDNIWHSGADCRAANKIKQEIADPP
jgi:hypothetical protein